MSILATPPRPTLGQHAPTLPADVLAALEGDSDEDNDHLPLSLYFKPDELLDSPDKQAQQQRQLNIRSHSSNLLSDLSNNPSQPEPISASRSSSSLSRSASVVQTQPQPRTFTRVASVPSNGQLRLRESDASPTSEDHPQSNRPRRSGSQGSDKDAFEPEVSCLLPPIIHPINPIILSILDTRFVQLFTSSSIHHKFTSNFPFQADHEIGSVHSHPWLNLPLQNCFIYLLQVSSCATYRRNLRQRKQS